MRTLVLYLFSGLRIVVLGLLVFLIFPHLTHIPPPHPISAKGVNSSPHLREVVLRQSDTYLAPRWEYGEDKLSPSDLVFQKIKTHFSDGGFQKCLKQVELALTQAPHLSPWLSLYRLRCSEALALSDGGDTKSLELAIVDISQHSDWLLKGAHVKSLRTDFLSALMTKLSIGVSFKVPSKGGVEKPSPAKLSAAWKTIDQLISYSDWLSSKQKAKIWDKGSDLARLEKRWLMAEDLLERSLFYHSSSRTRKKLREFRSEFLKTKGPASESAVKGEGKDKGSAQIKSTNEQKHLSALTKGEKKLLSQMRKAKSSIEAIRLGVQLINEYPGGEGILEAEDEVGDRLLSLGRGAASKKYKKALALALKSEGKSLYIWAKRAYRAELYSLSYELAQKSYEKMGKGSLQVPKRLRLIGMAAFHSDKRREAHKFWEILVNKYAASNEVEEVLMRLGMLHYREKKTKKAISYFERAIRISKEEKYEMISRYWLWRSMERLGSKSAVSVAQDLFTRFPLTYYGLRARMELSKGQRIPWPQLAESPVEAHLWLTEEEYRGWERFQSLLKVGWYSEAQKELLNLPMAKSVEEKLLVGILFSRSFDYLKGIRRITGAFEEKPHLLNLETLRAAYPSEYWKLIEKESSRYDEVDPLLVLSLMRQESAFNKNAKSVASAMGLMQLLKPTAKDMARQLKKRINVSTDLFHPPTNIQLGTRYMSQMIRAFDGHVLLGLAAYNTGIGHMRIWLKTRGELEKLAKQKDSLPDNEMWIDELPWQETSFYVKAILRNYIIYRALEKKEMVFHSPLWSYKKE